MADWQKWQIEKGSKKEESVTQEKVHEHSEK